MGSGLEIMANSDNVLRGGATRKHMDLYELINILSFETGTTKKILPSRLSIFESVYRSPAQEFMLSVIDLPDEKSVYHGRTLNSAEIIINLKGCGEVTDRANNMISLKRGASLFIPASAEEYHIRVSPGLPGLNPFCLLEVFLYSDHIGKCPHGTVGKIIFSGSQTKAGFW
jgi:mannose-6-phosphate isomerase